MGNMVLLNRMKFVMLKRGCNCLEEYDKLATSFGFTLEDDYDSMFCDGMKEKYLMLNDEEFLKKIVYNYMEGDDRAIQIIDAARVKGMYVDSVFYNAMWVQKVLSHDPNDD